MSESEKDVSALALLEVITTRGIFTAPIESLTNEQAAVAWSIVDFFESFSKDRKAALREHLLNTAKSDGEMNEKGSSTMILPDGTKVIREKSQAKLPDDETVKTLLKEAKLPVEAAFTPKQEWTLDASKLQFLVDGGKIPKEPIEAAKKTSYRLKVRPSKETANKLKQAKDHAK